MPHRDDESSNVAYGRLLEQVDQLADNVAKLGTSAANDHDKITSIDGRVKTIENKLRDGKADAWQIITLLVSIGAILVAIFKK